MAEAGKRWESQGVKIGAYLDDVSVYTLEGKGTRLASLWKDRPVLLVTASITCPVARRRCPNLKSIIEAHDPEVRTVLLYTIEAHPQSDHSPYRPGKEWVTPQNEEAKILHRQPTKLEDRLPLARDMHQQLSEVAPMLVDGMDNSAWKALGGGPNMAVLIDSDGKVIAKQGWLHVGKMESDIAALLKARSERALAEYETSKKARSQMEAFIEAVKSGEVGGDAKEKFLSPHARIWFDQKTGPGNPLGISPWREWDKVLNAHHDAESADSHVNAVTVTARETNDFSRLIDFPGWRAKSTYWFDAEGRIIEQLYEPMDVTPSFRECFKPALDWMTANKPEELRAIYPGNDFAPSADTAARWRAALIEWRAATGRAAIELSE